MHVFITGASGYIGHAVACAFRSQGHSVKGLIRSEAQEETLFAHEIIPVRGNLAEPRTYQHHIEEAEVIVHCAFDYSPNSVYYDLKLIDAVIETAHRSLTPKTFAYTSGIWVYGDCELQWVNEASPVNPLNIVKWRTVHEAKILHATNAQLRSIIFRPGIVYGGYGGLFGMWFDSARKGLLQVAGNGKNYWSMIHIEDLARAYVMATEVELTGILNVTNNIPLRVEEMANTLLTSFGSSIQAKIQYFSAEEATQQFGLVAEGLLANQWVKTDRLQRLTSWRPKHIDFLKELPVYYRAWEASRSS